MRVLHSLLRPLGGLTNKPQTRKTAQRGSKEARKQGSKEARKQGSKQASKQGSKEGSKQASKEARKEASKQAGKQASKESMPGETTNTQTDLEKTIANWPSRYIWPFLAGSFWGALCKSCKKSLGHQPAVVGLPACKHTTSH